MPETLNQTGSDLEDIAGNCQAGYEGSITANCQSDGSWQITNNSCLPVVCPAGSQTLWGSHSYYRLRDIDSRSGKNCTDSARYDQYSNMTLEIDLPQMSPGQSNSYNCRTSDKVYYGNGGSNYRNFVTGNIQVECSSDGSWQINDNCSKRCYSFYENQYFDDDQYSDKLHKSNQGCGSGRDRTRKCNGRCNGDTGQWYDIGKYKGSCG
mgnify:CR=1 FL=1